MEQYLWALAFGQEEMVKGEIEKVFFHVGPMTQRYMGNKHISSRIHHLFPNKTFLGKETTHTHPKKWKVRVTASC